MGKGRGAGPGGVVVVVVRGGGARGIILTDVGNMMDVGVGGGGLSHLKPRQDSRKHKTGKMYSQTQYYFVCTNIYIAGVYTLKTMLRLIPILRMKALGSTEDKLLCVAV